MKIPLQDFLLIPSIKTPLSIREEVKKLLCKKSFQIDGHFDSILNGPFRECIVEPSIDMQFFFRNQILTKYFPHLFNTKWLNPHLLEMKFNTYISPHKDQFCGNTIIVLSLGSTRTLSFSNGSKHIINDDTIYAFYASSRYQLEHEILPGNPGDLNRTSIIWRESLLCN